MNRVEKCVAKGRARQEQVIGFLLEMGFAQANQIRRLAMPDCVKESKGHYQLIRTLHRRGYISYFTNDAVLGKCWYATSPGTERLIKYYKDPDDLMEPLDYHSGRSPQTVRHQLGLCDLRINATRAGFDWTPERILSESAFKATQKKIFKRPDALMWKFDNKDNGSDYWSGFYPIAIEYERTKKSPERRQYIVYLYELLLGKVAAGVIVVGNKAILKAWAKTINRLTKNPEFEVKIRGSLRNRKIDVHLLRFWNLAEPYQLAEVAAEAKLFVPESGQPAWGYADYQPWTSWRRGISTKALRSDLSRVMFRA